MLRVVERRNGLSRVMMVGKYSVAWQKKAVEKMVCMAEDLAITESSRDRNRALISQKGVNRARRFLEVVEYAVGGCRGLIIAPEGCDGGGGGMEDFSPKSWGR